MNSRFYTSRRINLVTCGENLFEIIKELKGKKKSFDRRNTMENESYFAEP